VHALEAKNAREGFDFKAV